MRALRPKHSPSLHNTPGAAISRPTNIQKGVDKMTNKAKSRIVADAVKIASAMIDTTNFLGGIGEVSSANARCDVINGYYLFITIDETHQDFLWITLENSEGESIDEQDTKGFTIESIEQAVYILLNRNDLR